MRLYDINSKSSTRTKANKVCINKTDSYIQNIYVKPNP